MIATPAGRLPDLAGIFAPDVFRTGAVEAVAEPASITKEDLPSGHRVAGLGVAASRRSRESRQVEGRREGPVPEVGQAAPELAIVVVVVIVVVIAIPATIALRTHRARSMSLKSTRSEKTNM